MAMERNMISVNNNNSRKSGVALIIVLGLVAVLMITTVAFTTMMRVERSGSANLRHSTLARQVVKGALAYALADLDSSIPPSDAMPMWRNTNDISQLYWTYKRKNRDGSYDNYTLWKDTMISIAGESCDADVISAEAERYLLPGIAYKGFGKTLRDGGEISISQPQWIPVRPDGTNITGRFAYIIFNNSGLLDINVVNSDDRRMGQYPEEIQISEDIFGAEFKNQKEMDDFLDRRNSAGEFATIAEMMEFGEAPESLASFDTYSFQPQPNTNGFSLVDISGSVASLQGKKKEIIEAFFRSGLVVSSDEYKPASGRADSEQALCAYLSLLDYVDNDSKPSGTSDLEKFCRPVSEEMPVFAGGEALVTITRTQVATTTKDESTGLQVPTVDKNKCKYELRVMGKIPFVWNFDKKFNSDESVVCEGKMAVVVDDAGSLGKLFDTDEYKNRSVITMHAEYGDGGEARLITPQSTDNASDWILNTSAEIDEPSVGKDGKYTEPNLDDLVLQICFAGSTYMGKVSDADRVRVCPFDLSKYKKDKSNLKDIADYWPKVTFSPKKEGMKFLPAPEDEPYKVKVPVEVVNGEEKKTEMVEVCRWVAHKIVWVEVLDPCFASFAMQTRDSDGLKENGFYRPSVDASMKEDSGKFKSKFKSQDNLMNGAPTQYLRDLSSTKALFNEFTAADVSNTKFDLSNEIADYKGDAREESDKRRKKRDEDDSASFIECGYFTNSNKGASPLTDYILANAEIIGGTSKKSSLGIYSDGLQYGSGGKLSDPAFMHRRRYVRNDQIESIGEVGYIQVGPFSTIKLYDHGWGNGLDDDPFEDLDQLSSDYSADFRDFAAVPGYGALSKGNMVDYMFLPWTMKTKNKKIQADARGYHTVLDYFTTAPDVTRGKININSSVLNVLASAYYDMPLNNDGYSIDNKYCRRLKSERALDMADLLSQVKGGFHCLSDFGKIYKVQGIHKNGKKVEKNGSTKIVIAEDTEIDNDLSLGAQILYAAIDNSNDPLESEVDGKKGFGSVINDAVVVKTENKNRRFGEFEREALIRNACGLFTDSGQTFTIVLRAEAFSSYYGASNVREGTVNAVKTAVAQVWRDSTPRVGPEYNKNGDKKQINPFVIRSFKIIDE